MTVAASRAWFHGMLRTLPDQTQQTQSSRRKVMGRILLAFRVFFRVLFNAGFAEQVRALSETGAPPPEPRVEQVEKPKVAEKPQEPKPERSEAITLLATLQREARFIDFVKEPIDAYNDAQIGAAAREVHRDCAQVLERLFGLQPVVAQDEGCEIDVPENFETERFRLTGKVGDQPPWHGRLVHHGWEAAKCELPKWTGNPTQAFVVTAAEVEIQ